MSSFLTSALFDILLVIYVLDCAFMGLVIMMQRSKQEGLGAAIGGGFMQEFAGAQTSAVLVRATVWAAALFFILSISLARLSSHQVTLDQQQNAQGSSVDQELKKSLSAPAPAVTNATSPITPSAPSVMTNASSASAKVPATAPVPAASATPAKAPATPTH